MDRHPNSTSCVAENALKLFRFVGSGGGGSGSGMASDSTVADVNGGERGSLNGEPVVKRPRESGSHVLSLRVPKEPQNKVTVVLGAQWGDEGKGKVVDLLAMDADIVCRCQVRHEAAGPAFIFFRSLKYCIYSKITHRVRIIRTAAPLVEFVTSRWRQQRGGASRM